MRDERERRKDEAAVRGAGARRDPVNEESTTRPADTRSGRMREDVASRDPHAPGVSESPLDAQGANVRDRGTPTRESGPSHLGNKAYQGETGRGEELTRENADGERASRRSSRERVSPADVENVTEPSGRDVNQ